MPINVNKEELLKIQADMNTYYKNTQIHEILTRKSKKDIGRCKIIVKTEQETFILDSTAIDSINSNLTDTAKETLKNIDSRLKKFICQSILGGNTCKHILTAFNEKNYHVNLNGNNLTYTATQIAGTESYVIKAENDIASVMNLDNYNITPIEKTNKNKKEIRYALELKVDLASNTIEVISLYYPDPDKIINNNLSLFQKIINALSNILIKPIVTLFNVIKSFFTKSNKETSDELQSPSSVITPHNATDNTTHNTDSVLYSSVTLSIDSSLNSTVDIQPENSNSESDLDSPSSPRPPV